MKAHSSGRWSSAPLSVQLTVWYTTASFVFVAVATAALYFGLARNLRKVSRQALLDEVDICRALVRERGGASRALREEVEIDSVARRYQKFFIRVLDSDGGNLSTTPGMDQVLSVARFASAAPHNAGISELESPDGVPYLAVVSTVPRDYAGREGLMLQIAVDLTQEREILEHQRVWVWTVLASGLLLSPAVGLAIARRGTRPLRDVAATAHRIGSSTLSERIQAEGYPAEVRTLAVAFNAMLGRLEDSFTRLSRFSADLAHELRTPVNNIRGEAEVALARVREPGEYAEVLGSCLEESVRLSELIEALLFTARSEGPGDPLKRSRENLRQMLTELRDYYEAAAVEAGVALHVGVPDGLAADVDRTLLQRALGNLISNALAHSPEGGEIRMTAARGAGGIEITITDTGAGIPPEALPRVFDRFYRADPARARNSGGAGLGLAIVKQVLALHGGDVQIASVLGQGTEVRLTLPDSVS